MFPNKILIGMKDSQQTLTSTSKVNDIYICGCVSKDYKKIYVEFYGMKFGHKFFEDIIGIDDTYIRFRVSARDLINGNGDIRIIDVDDDVKRKTIEQKCKEIRGVIQYFPPEYDGKHTLIYDCTGFRVMGLIVDIIIAHNFDYVGLMNPLIDM